MKNKYNGHEAKQIDIVQFLSKQGILPKRKYNYYYMYSSPLREDKNPSFKVNIRKNRWYDFGLQRGGSIIDLVMIWNQCIYKEAVIILLDGISFPKFNIENYKSADSVGVTLKTLTVSKIQKPELLEYLKPRCINQDLIDKYLVEIYYQHAGTKRCHYSVGILNDSGAYEMTNSRGKNSTESTKDITSIIKNNGLIFVFEGMFDWLSYMTIFGDKDDANYLILNSVSNKNRALPILQNHSQVDLYLDNDFAGTLCTNFFMKELNNVHDCRGLFSKYENLKDLNDYLIKLRRSK